MEALLRVDFRKEGLYTEINLHHERLTNPRYLETIRHGASTHALDALDALLGKSPTKLVTCMLYRRD